MTVRDGMANVILALRAWAEAGTAEYTLTGTTSQTYWSDQHLQDVLDQHREDHYFEVAQVAPREGNTAVAEYYDYYFDGGYWEEASGGTAVWIVQDSTGADAGTANYTINYQTGHIRFTANTLGTAYYLTGRKYDLHRAAAQVWRQKAANVANRYDVSTDNHSLKRSQLSKQYLDMAAYYDKQSPVRFVRMMRVDVNG